MIYPMRNNATNYGGIGTKSTGDVLKELKVTKVTLFGWIRNGIIKADKVPAGTRSFYVFSDDEIERFKRFLPKKRKRGSQIITDKIIESITVDRVRNRGLI